MPTCVRPPTRAHKDFGRGESKRALKNFGQALPKKRIRISRGCCPRFVKPWPFVTYSRARLDNTNSRSETITHTFHPKFNSSAFVLWSVRVPVLDRRPYVPPNCARRDVGRKRSTMSRTISCTIVDSSAHVLWSRQHHTYAKVPKRCTKTGFYERKAKAVRRLRSRSTRRHLSKVEHMSAHHPCKSRLERIWTLVGTGARARSSAIGVTEPRSTRRWLQTVA